MKIEIPDRLVAAILFVRGEEDGKAWLEVLPRRVDLYLRRWNLTPLSVAEGGAMSCCLFCATADGVPAVLKIPFDAASGRLESRSLQRWGRAGASPTVLETAPRSGVFSMTRVVPGTIAAPANSPSDSERMNGLIESMLRPNLGPMSGLKRIEHVVKTRFEWAYERFADPGYAHQAGLMPGVENLLEALRRTDGTRTVIHGDLQQKNVLIGNDGEWQVIDPLTCRGDVNADAALWAVVQEDGSTLEQRIEELSESPCLDRARLEAWCYVLGVAEYRTYQPETAARIDRFVDVRNWRDLAGPLGS